MPMCRLLRSSCPWRQVHSWAMFLILKTGKQVLAMLPSDVSVDNFDNAYGVL